MEERERGAMSNRERKKEIVKDKAEKEKDNDIEREGGT